MSEQPTTPVEQPTEKKRRFKLPNKQTLVKVGAATGGVLLAGVYLKRKLNASGSCSVDADLHVETADQSDNG